jgi:NitT/TauT family transport system substrate-binding protein
MKLLSFIFVFALLSACSTQKESDSLKIIANSWIGYSPLFYAKESGWLEPINIKLSTVISLGESLNIYESAKLDAFTGTQYEFNQVQQKDPSLMPIIMFDRSNGGDMVMANQTIQSLQHHTQVIDVYLEINSVNHLVFKDFIKQHHLTNKTFNYINKDQLKIFTILQETPSSNPVIVVTYSPYNQKLSSLGLQTLATTKNGLELLVVDALFTSKKTFLKHQAQFTQLNALFNKALIALKKDPFEYYEKVKPHLENTSYDDFLTSIEGVEWLNEPLSPALQKRLNDAHFPTQDLL